MGRSLRLLSLPALVVLLSACIGREFTSGPDGAGGSGSTGGQGGGGGNVARECPTDLKGPELLKVPDLAGGAYCIDKTEVTNRQYRDWLDTGPSIDGQDAFCAWNDNFGDPGAGNDDLPVAHVDWCDAKAYCKAVGKRLCGHISGGAIPYDAFADASQSQWYSACSEGGARVYPYGNDYIENHCVTADYNGIAGPDAGDVPLPVAQAFQCSGGYLGLFDMSGNVYEWEDSCDAASGDMDKCRVRGGAYVSDAMISRCDADTFQVRSVAAPPLGFRCCYDL